MTPSEDFRNLVSQSHALVSATKALSNLTEEVLVELSYDSSYIYALLCEAGVHDSFTGFNHHCDFTIISIGQTQYIRNEEKDLSIEICHVALANDLTSTFHINK